MNSNKVIDEPDFSEWLTPSQVFDFLGGPLTGRSIARCSQITARLRVGLIHARAKLAIYPNDSRDHEEIVDSVCWPEDAPILPNHDFWDTGDIALAFILDDGRPTSCVFFDVRFHPEHIKELVPSEISSSTHETPETSGTLADATNNESKKILPENMLERWAELFLEVTPIPSERQARLSIDAMFPSHHVTRARLRRILPDRPIGKPRKIKINKLAKNVSANYWRVYGDFDGEFQECINSSIDPKTGNRWRRA